MVIVSDMSLSKLPNGKWRTSDTISWNLEVVVDESKGIVAIAMKSTTHDGHKRYAEEQLRKNPHENVGQLVDMCMTENGYIRFFTTTCVITDTLHNHVSQSLRVTLSVILRVLWQLLSVVKRFQFLGFNHCELTPHTIMTDANFMIISVLGVGKAIPEPDNTHVEPDKTSYQQLPLTETSKHDKYSSPEARFANRVFKTGTSDIYAIAMIGFFMLHHYSNANQPKNDDTIRLNALRTLLQKMRDHDPHKRMPWQRAYIDPIFNGLRT